MCGHASSVITISRERCFACETMSRAKPLAGKTRGFQTDRETYTCNVYLMTRYCLKPRGAVRRYAVQRRVAEIQHYAARQCHYNKRVVIRREPARFDRLDVCIENTRYNVIIDVITRRTILLRIRKHTSGARSSVCYTYRMSRTSITLYVLNECIIIRNIKNKRTSIRTDARARAIGLVR